MSEVNGAAQAAPSPAGTVALQRNSAMTGEFFRGGESGRLYRVEQDGLLHSYPEDVSYFLGLQERGTPMFLLEVVAQAEVPTDEKDKETDPPPKTEDETSDFPETTESEQAESEPDAITSVVDEVPDLEPAPEVKPAAETKIEKPKGKSAGK